MPTMKALDTLHISSVGPDSIEPGAEFEVNDDEALQLEDKRQATRVTTPAKPVDKSAKAK